MDKRTLLALALSVLVFLVWSVLFGPKSKEEPGEKQPTLNSEQSRSPAKERKTPPGPKRDLMLEAERDLRDITVETALYMAVFSGSGPQIKSFQLKKYHTTPDEASPLKELISVNNRDGYGLNIGFSGESIPNIEWASYKVTRQYITLREGDQPEGLVYEWESPQGVGITTQFLFRPARYEIDLSVTVTNKSDYVIDDALLFSLAHVPQETKRRYRSFEGMALLLDEKLKEVKTSKLEGKQFLGDISWVAYEEPYFMTAVIGQNGKKATAKAAVLPDGEVRISYMPPPLGLSENESVTKHFTLYLGPRDLYVLKSLDKNLEKAINFGWFDIIAKPLLVALRFFTRYLPKHNYGLSIIVLTVLIKILFWPLTRKSYQSMREMRKLQPMMAKIREKYKHNKQEMNRQIMGLYKTYKINPMGGCLPMLVQIPVFFAFYRILPNSIELRHAPFILWIKDLSAPERLFSFPFEIPLMAPPYGIPVLTLLMGASMFLQQKMTPMTGDPAQAKMMMLLPIVFTFLFINFPSGLVLYWLVNNVLSIAQQYRINRQLG